MIGTMPMDQVSYSETTCFAEFIEFVDIRQNDIDSQWILRQGRKLKLDPPKKVIPRQKKFNRRTMKYNRMRVTLPPE
jgi:hypothetical protein